MMGDSDLSVLLADICCHKQPKEEEYEIGDAHKISLDLEVQLRDNLELNIVTKRSDVNSSFEIFNKLKMPICNIRFSHKSHEMIMYFRPDLKNTQKGSEPQFQIVIQLANPQYPFNVVKLVDLISESKEIIMTMINLQENKIFDDCIKVGKLDQVKTR